MDHEVFATKLLELVEAADQRGDIDIASASAVGDNAFGVEFPDGSELFVTVDPA